MKTTARDPILWRKRKLRWHVTDEDGGYQPRRPYDRPCARRDVQAEVREGLDLYRERARRAS